MTVINNPKMIEDVIICTTYSLGRLAIALRENDLVIPASIIEINIKELASLIGEKYK